MASSISLIEVVIWNRLSKIGTEKLATAAASRPPAKPQIRSKPSCGRPPATSPPIAFNASSAATLTNPTTAPARVITVTSTLHRKGEINFDAFKGFEKYNAQVAYNQSKLANVLFGVELAQRLEGTGVTSNVLHPGAVATEIVRDLPWLVRKIIGLLFMAPEKGAKTTVMLASDEALTEVTGKYYDQCELTETSPLADDTALRAKLWDVSAAAVGLA